MPLRKVRNADDAISCLTASTAAGEARATWARRHGTNPRSLNAWWLNLECPVPTISPCWYPMPDPGSPLSGPRRIGTLHQWTGRPGGTARGQYRWDGTDKSLFNLAEPGLTAPCLSIVM